MEEKDNQKKKKFDRRPVRPFPKHSLAEVLVIAQAIQDRNGGKPMKKLLVADAINRKPTSPGFRDLLSSSFKYGLTSGTEKAEVISLTKLGEEITKPLNSKMEIKSKQKAIMQPEVFNKVYSHFKDKKFQVDSFFENLLEKQFEIPREYVKEVAQILDKNGKYVGIIRNISGSPYISFDVIPLPINKEERIQEEESEEGLEKDEKEEVEEMPKPTNSFKKPKVFISHSKNKKIVEQIKKILEFGQFDYVIAEERETTAIPIAEKVFGLMKDCNCAIINLSVDEQKEKEGEYQLNQNVLIEIGAAFLQYNKKVILLVDKRFSGKIPSNLDGLYRSEYEGNELSFDTAMKLQRALSEFRKK